MANRIQIRRDSEDNWERINPTLSDGELGLNYDNNQIKIGDGTNTWTSLSYSSSSTGNVTFSDQVIVGTGDIDGGGSGLYLSPGANSTANLQYLRVRGGDDSGHIHLDTGNNTIYDQFFGNDDKYLKLEAGATGNIVISTDGTYEWQFGSDGDLTLPQGTTISEATNIVTVTLDQFTDGGYPGTQVFTKLSDTLYQALPSGPTMGLVGGLWKLAVGVSVYYESLDLITWTALGGALPAPVGTPEILEILNLTVVDKVWALDDNGNITLPTNSSSINYANGTSILSGLGAGGIALTDISVGAPNSASGGGSLSYANTTGVFTYTPPVIPDVSGFALSTDIPDVSGFALSTDIPDVSGFVTGTPWTSAGYLTTITNIFNQDLNTTNNVTFNSVITSNVQATNGSPAVASPVAVGGAGAPLTIGAGDGGIAATGVNAGAGGNLTITAGDAGSDIGNPSWGEIGGTLVIRGGNSSRPYHGSDVQIHSGNAVTSPGAISLYTGTNQWTFGKDGTTTLANNATIISPLTGLTVRVTGQYNICTIQNAGSGYGGGGSSSAVSGGSGTGMIVGYGYGLSGQVSNVGVTDPGTGYQEGDVLTMTAGNGDATFVITKYNTAANAGNNNTAPSDWIFGTTNNLTLPLGGDIKDSTGTSVLFSGDYTDLSNQPTILAEPAFTVKTTDFNATAGSRYGFDTTAGVVTATLPASPSAGDAIYFADASGTTSTNNFIIARNSQTIMGSASNMTVNVNDQSFGLFYNGTTWRVY